MQINASIGISFNEEIFRFYIPVINVSRINMMDYKYDVG